MSSQNEPAGIFVRVSSGGQDEANQVPDIERHCTTKEYTIARRYELNDIRASIGEQQETLDAMVEDMRNGVIKVCVCWWSDRMERRGPEAVFKLLREVKDAGGRLESVNEPLFGSDDMTGEATTALGAVISHQESIKISYRTNAGLRTCRTNGAIYNGNIPWGFDIVGARWNKTIVPTDQCREIVPQIFQRCIDGQSLRQIAAWLDSTGAKPKKHGKTRKNKKTGEVRSVGEKWNEGSVRWIIRTRAYAGRLLNGKGETVLELPESDWVVQPSVFERANEALKSHPKRGPAKNPPLLANLRCARCADKGVDSPMFRVAAGKKKINKYRCYGRGPQRQGCGNLVLLERLDTRVVVYMLTQNDKLHSVKEWVEGESYDNEISNVKQDIRELTEAERFGELSPLTAKLAELREKQENATTGHYAKFYVRKSDGSLVPEDEHLDYLDDLLTEGEYFFDLDDAERREYLETLDVRAEKTADGIRLVIAGEEIEPNPYETALLDIVGSDIAKIMLERRIPDAAEWQAFLRGEPVPGADIAAIAQMFKDAQRR